MKTKKIFRFLFAALLLFFMVYFAVGYIRSLRLESTLIQLSLPSHTNTIGTVRVVQVSDLHRAEYGQDNQQLSHVARLSHLVRAPFSVFSYHTIVSAKRKDTGKKGAACRLQIGNPAPFPARSISQ